MNELHTLDELCRHIDAEETLEGVAVQEVDVSSIEERLRALPARGALFLGCAMSAETQARVQANGGLVMQAPPALPFAPFRAHLYTAGELFDAFDPAAPASYCDCLDAHVYDYWRQSGRAHAPFITDAVFRGLHDQSVSDALHDYLDATRRPVVAMMGGHSMPRGSRRYREVAQIARRLTQRGYLMVSGGGPGAMEATHLGALTSARPAATLSGAIDHLATAPSYRDERWLAAAFEVLDDLGARPDAHRRPASGAAATTHADLCESVGIPTWHYGHEPPTPFATHIAKYFANSIREAGLVTIAHGGIIFAPGSAGTIQEVFQDAAQNHYATTGHASPMVFFGEDYWRNEKPVYGLLEELARGHAYGDLLRLVDTAPAAVEALDALDPVAAEEESWSFCGAHGEAGDEA